MKKIFSTVSMAVAAIAAVVTMSSCQNDSPSSFNAAPQIQTKTQPSTDQSKGGATQKSYTYNLTLSDDILAIFDVQTTVTAGTETKTFTSADFSKATMISNPACGLNEAGKAVASYTVKADKATVKTTVTLKSNWKEILDGMNKKEYGFYYQYNSTISGFAQSANKCTEEYLKGAASRLSDRLSD